MKRRLLMMLAAALIWSMISATPVAVTEETPEQLRLRLSDTLTVFIEFREREMMLSTKIEGFQATEPVQAFHASAANQEGNRFAQFPKVVLPLTKNQLLRHFSYPW